jgi:pSer/pThr/pTyr-binding forkhead associated (FHA) protein
VERVVLVHVSGVRAGQREVYAIARLQSLYLGRGPECDVRFDAELELMVSRSHAVLEWTTREPRTFSLTDLLSRNGSFINGQKLNGVRELKTGDEIQLGVSGPVLRFELEQDDIDAPVTVTRSIPSVSFSPTTGERPAFDPQGSSKPTANDDPDSTNDTVQLRDK